MKAVAPIFCLFLALGTVAQAQQGQKAESPYVLLGRKALLDGDFKLAVTHLEKALPLDTADANLLYTLGYSYYHSSNYPKAINSFSKVVSLKPKEVTAYYYRGKARNNMATEMNTTLSYQERESLLQASVRDFTKAIELNGEDLKYYQNRGIAYRDLGILKSQKATKVYDKTAATTAYKACITDLQRVLDANPARTDIVSELKKAKVYMANL